VRLIQPLLTWFQGLDQARRVRLLAVVAIAVVAAVGLGWWASEESWVPVVSGKGYEAAASAASAVERVDIPYRLHGDTLQVPANRVGAARTAIATETDLPGLSDVAGLELGLTPQAQQWAFLREAEGDLARMLNGIEGIVASQVHLVPASEALFVGDERPASASVFLKLEPGKEMSTGQVRAITSLVANAVDGLQPERVSVADDRGNLLATGTGEGDLGEMEDLHEYRSSLERKYERAVAQSLLPVLGFGSGFSVTAAVELDLTAKETTSRNVDADRQAVVSEVNEESTDSRSRPVGVPGVDANLPERDPGAGAGGSSSSRNSSTVNYSYPTVDEIARRPAGGLQRLSVAVQVDQARLAQLVQAANGSPDESALRQQIEAAVKAAVGFDDKRKDTVAVSYLPFAAPVWVEGTEQGGLSSETVRVGASYLLPLVAVLLLFWFVVRPVVAAAVRPLEPEIVQAEVVPEGSPTTAAIEEESVTDRLRRLVDNFEPLDSGELNVLIERESESAAEVLRQWNRV
jgi:flagellar M-ring protein FliF